MLHMAVKPIPDGLRTLTPHLTVDDAKKAIAFYEAAFGAKLLSRSDLPDGKVMHAALQIGDSQLFLNDPFGPPPARRGGIVIHIAVEDAKAAWERATKAGAVVVMPLEDQFWGDRYGSVEDPFGVQWSIGQHIEDVSPEEIERRSKDAMAKMGMG